MSGMQEEVMPAYAKNIKALRKSKHWTQARLGMELFVSRATVSHWERGEVEPAATNLIRMSKIFKVTVDYIVGN